MRMISAYFRSAICALSILACVLAFSPNANSNAIGDLDRDLFEYIHEDMQSKFLDNTMSPLTRMGDLQR